MNITIAIPSYNKEKYIKRCIESALLEKDHVTKIILVDNQSTDKTLEIAKQYEPYITCIQNESNLGMAKNWNRCIELCDTEWLMILHADDELLPHAIQKYTEFIKKYPSVGIIHANSYSVVEGSEASRSYTKKNQKEFWHAGLEGMQCHYGVCSAVIVRKDVYNNLGHFIESLSSDAEMWSRIASTYDVGFIDEPTVIYHVNDISTGVVGLTKRSVWEIKKDWDNLYNTIAKHYPTEKDRKDFLKKYFKSCPESYYAIAKANIKVKKYYQALEVLFVIIFVYRGLFPLLQLIWQDVKKRL